MQRPTTAAGGAVALLDLAADDRRPLPFGVYNLPGDAPLEALARSAASFFTETVRRPRRPLDDSSLVRSLPPVLVPVPEDGPDRPALVGAVLDATPDPEAGGDDWAGFPYPVGVPLDPGPRERDRQRVRRLVLAGPEASPTPHGSRALVVSVLAARAVAADLDKWAALLPARSAVRADKEAATYRAYAAEAEALIPASFEWADGLENPALTPAFSSVPATLRGVVVRGDST